MKEIIIFQIHMQEQSSFFSLPSLDHRDLLRKAAIGEEIDWRTITYEKVNRGQDCTFSSFGNLIFYCLHKQQLSSILDKIPGLGYRTLQKLSGKPQLYILSNIETIDALDFNNSSVERLENGKIFLINKFCFRPDLLGGKYLFYIKDYVGLFCTNNFTKMYKDENWTGFQFEEVWRGGEEKI